MLLNPLQLDQISFIISIIDQSKALCLYYYHFKINKQQLAIAQEAYSHPSCLEWGNILLDVHISVSNYWCFGHTHKNLH